MATIQLPPDFKEFLRLLNSKGAEYLLVGGYAVSYHGCIEIFTTISGVIFEECYEKRLKTVIDEIQVNLIGLDDLKRNKRAGGRTKDIDDLQNLP